MYVLVNLIYKLPHTSGTSIYRKFPYDQARSTVSASQYCEAVSQAVSNSPSPSGIFQQRLNDHNTYHTDSGRGSRPDYYAELDYQFEPQQYGQFEGVRAPNCYNQHNQQQRQNQRGGGEQRWSENNMKMGYYPLLHADYCNSKGAYGHPEGTKKRGFSDEPVDTGIQRRKPAKKRVKRSDNVPCSPLLEGDEPVDTGIQRKKPKKRVKRSDDMPRAPLSAYNFFFSEEREVALALLSASVNDLEEYEQDDIIPDAVSCSSEDPSIITFTNEFPTFENQQEEFDHITRILSCRKMCKAKNEELRARIEANTDKKLNTLYEGDKVKKVHRKSHGKITFQVLSRLIGQRWRDISDPEVKQRYFDLAKKDLKRYNFHMNEYKQKNLPEKFIGHCR